MRKSLEFAEIRGRLQDAEVELAELRQSAPESPPQPLVHRSGERWLVLEMLPEVRSVFQISSDGVHGDLSVRGKMSRKWTDAVRAEGVDSTGHCLHGSVVQQQSSYQGLEGKRPASLGLDVSEEHSRSSINLFMTSRRRQRQSCRLFEVLARMFLSTVHLV